MEYSSSPQLTKEIISAFKEQKPTLRDRFDALNLVLHFVMKKFGFTFIGCGENDQNVNQQALAPEGWNCSSDTFSFRYKHPKSNTIFTIKNLVMGNKLLINGVREDGTIQSLEVNIDDYVNDGIALDNFDTLFKNLNSLVSKFQTNIINKILPEGVKEPSRQNIPQNQQPRRYDPSYDPLRVPGRYPRQPISPLMEPYQPGYGQPYQPPFSVGGNDLYPSGPFFGPSIPTGNLIGPNHPGFGPSVNDPYGGNPFPNGDRGRGIPPPPTGARFDPFAPPGSGAEPDRDEEPPKGFYDYYL